MRGSTCLLLLIVVIIFAQNVLTLGDHLNHSRLAANVEKNSNQHFSCDLSIGVTAKLLCLCFYSLANTLTVCSLKASLKRLSNLSPVAYAVNFFFKQAVLSRLYSLSASCYLTNVDFFFSSVRQDQVFCKYDAAHSFYCTLTFSVI